MFGGSSAIQNHLFPFLFMDLGEIDGLLVPPGTDSNQLTDKFDYWLTAHV